MIQGNSLYTAMNRTIPSWIIAAILTIVMGCSTPPMGKLLAASGQEHKELPFVVSIIPTVSEDEPIGCRISIAKTSPGTFYVILTNKSKGPQNAFENWNSWGYRAVSFEVQTADGLKAVITKNEHDFTRNFPSTFTIQSGEHMVYSISLDHEWKTVPSLPMADATPISITIKAIYEVRPTPEAAKEKVWTGRAESNSYHCKLRHW